jgi:hypothetical protein
MTISIIMKKAFKFLLLGALIFIVTYYFYGKENDLLITLGMIFLGCSFLTKIIELNLLRRKNKQ